LLTDERKVSLGSRFGVAVFALALAAPTAYAAMAFGDGHDMVNHVLTGTASLPFQQRILSYLAVGGVHVLGGGALSLPSAESIFYFFACASLFYLFYFLLRDYFDRVTSLWSVFFMGGTLAMAWIMPPLSFRYPHDATTPIFFIGLTHAIFTRRWRLWYLLLPLAMLNRETVVVLLPCLFVIEWLRGNKKEAWIHAVVSLVVVLGMKAFVVWLFSGAPFIFMLDRNILVLFFGMRGWWPHLGILSVYAGLWLASPWGFSRLPREMKVMFLALALAVVLMFTFANINETRVWCEYGIYVVPAGVLGLGRLRKSLRRFGPSLTGSKDKA